MASWFFAFPARFELCLNPPSKVRLLHPEDRHLTVAFFGSCGEQRARKAAALAPQAPGFRISLRDPVMLGRQDRPAAMAATVYEGQAELEAFITTWRDRLRAAAELPPEDGRALPHITVARVARQAADSEYETATGWWRKQTLGGVRVKLGRLALFAPAVATSDTNYRILEV